MSYLKTEKAFMARYQNVQVFTQTQITLKLVAEI